MARSEPGPSSAAPRPQRGKARIVLTVPLLLVKAPNPSLGSFRAPRLQEAPVRSLMYPFPQPTCRHVFTKHLLCARQYDSKGRLMRWHGCAACWDVHRVRQVREPQGKKEIREGFLEAEKA